MHSWLGQFIMVPWTSILAQRKSQMYLRRPNSISHEANLLQAHRELIRTKLQITTDLQGAFHSLPYSRLNGGDGPVPPDAQRSSMSPSPCTPICPLPDHFHHRQARPPQMYPAPPPGSQWTRGCQSFGPCCAHCKHVCGRSGARRRPYAITSTNVQNPDQIMAMPPPACMRVSRLAQRYAASRSVASAVRTIWYTIWMPRPKNKPSTPPGLAERVAKNPAG